MDCAQHSRTWPRPSSLGYFYLHKHATCKSQSIMLVPQTRRLLRAFKQYVNYLIILYGPPVFFAKLSVLLQLQHIFIPKRRTPIFFVIQALIWANLAFYLAYLFVDIFQCVPRRKIWEPTVPGKCISTNVLNLAPAGINIVSDCLILVLPIVLVFRLKMTLKNKLAIAAIFSSGSL